MATWDNAVWVDPLVLATMLTVLGGAAWRAWRPARRAWRSLTRMLEDWHGSPERPGVPRRAGVMERLEALEELRPNGGSSVRDRVERIARQVGGAE